jgi:hypothetical protein
VTRRVLAGLIAGAIAALVYWYFQNRGGMIAVGAVTMAVYGFIDWLGVLPPPYGPHLRLLWHGDNEPQEQQDLRPAHEIARRARDSRAGLGAVVCKRTTISIQGAASWDRWWRERIADNRAETFPCLPAPMLEYRNRLIDPNRVDVLISVIAEYGLRSVLCAGNGISQEPWTLAAAGLNVTVLDISGVATRFAETIHNASGGLDFSKRRQPPRPGGRVEFVIGDLLDLTMCPGPFDVVIERRTVQVLPEDVRPAALSALSQRLAEVGIFLSVCLDDPFPPDLGWSQHRSGLYHASQSWFEQNGWTLWDGVPSGSLAGRVAWLVRAGSAKPRPRR